MFNLIWGLTVSFDFILIMIFRLTLLGFGELFVLVDEGVVLFC